MVGRAVGVVAALAVAGAFRLHRKKSSALSACGAKGYSEPNDRIVNGEDATECEWRWQAMLQRYGSSFCGGSLITPEWVLTAAHCVSSANFDVVLGNHDRSVTSDNEQKRSAVVVVRHPSYSSSGYTHDYAMVKLSSPVEINDCVGTVCLPSEDDDVTGNETCWITGWGTLRSGGSTPRILQEATVGIVSNHDCCNKFGYSCSQIDDSMICAQGRLDDGRITDACQGDSGGPLVCDHNGQWTLYGATSWGRGCAFDNYPGVWARVPEVMDWVEDTLAGIFPTPAPTPAPAPTPPGGWKCPSETSSGPDSDGDCRCNNGLTCYEGASAGCTFSYTASNGYKSTRWFLPSCSGCKCQ